MSVPYFTEIRIMTSLTEILSQSMHSLEKSDVPGHYFSNLFDRALLSKPSAFGGGPSTCLWIESLLMNRSQGSEGYPTTLEVTTLEPKYFKLTPILLITLPFLTNLH